MDEDRISALPDDLILEILSRLPKTKEAIKTSTLSKRWQHIWTQVPNLIFIPNDYAVLLDDDEATLFWSVEKTLPQCSPELNLNKFQVYVHDYHALSASDIDEWIRYAVKRNVHELDLSIEPFDWGCDYEYWLDKFCYINSCFTHLKLKACRFDPSETISWNKLKSLSIAEIELDEYVIQKIVSGSPLLETFELSECSGYRQIDITSKSVKNLVISGYINYNSHHDANIIKINAPYIVSLTIADKLWLSKLLLVDVSCLVKAHLDYTNHIDNYTTREQVEQALLRGLILKLHHVKELTIGTDCAKVLSHLEAKGYTVPSNMKYLDIRPAVYSYNRSS